MKKDGKKVRYNAPKITTAYFIDSSNGNKILEYYTWELVSAIIKDNKDRHCIIVADETTDINKIYEDVPDVAFTTILPAVYGYNYYEDKNKQINEELKECNNIILSKETLLYFNENSLHILKDCNYLIIAPECLCDGFPLNLPSFYEDIEYKKFLLDRYTEYDANKIKWKWHVLPSNGHDDLRNLCDTNVLRLDGCGVVVDFILVFKKMELDIVFY